MTIWTESTIITAVVGMVGLIATAVIMATANGITSSYYSKKI